ncbi:MAG: S8 family serine peptidase [Armatimonadetes bacterium]|nr:S8 family serine peptidase [Armatimonadota bacterium]
MTKILGRTIVRGTKSLFLVCGILIAVQGWAAQGFVRRPAPSREYAANQVMVTLRPGYTEADLSALNAAYGSRVVRRLSNGSTFLLDLPGSGAPSESFVASGSAIARKYPAVQGVQHNYYHEIKARPNDEYFNAYYDTLSRLMGQWYFQPDPSDAAIKHVYATEAWDLQQGSSDIIVAVIDTGIRTKSALGDDGTTYYRTPHPDLVGRLIVDPAPVLSPYGVIPPDTAMGDNDPSPPENAGAYVAAHGTMVAGLIAAQGDNTIGISGMCWNGVKILPVKVATDEDGLIWDDAVFDALEYCIRYRDTELTSSGFPKRVNVINMSFGRQTLWPSTLVSQIQRAAASGIILVSTSGNEWESGPYPPDYPAALDEVICVGSTDRRDVVSTFSQRGRALDIVAPGEDVISTAFSPYLAEIGPVDSGGGDNGGGGGPPINPPGYYPSQIQAIGSLFPDKYGNYIAEFISGSSFATAIVSGAAALLMSQGVPAADVKNMLYSTATPKGFGRPNETYGWGLLNVRAALEKASIDVQIQTPAKSSVVTSARPRIRIDFRHALASSIRVWLDKGTAGQVLLIGGSGAAIQDWSGLYYTLDAAAGKTYLQFDYPIAAGSHTITASADSDILFDSELPVAVSAEDSSTFIVRAATLNPGWHMFSVPYKLDSSVTPDQVIGTGSQLWRYAYTDGESPRYAAYAYGARMDNEATFHPYSVIANLSVRPSGSAVATPPAGLGYWLRVRSSGWTLPGLNPATASEVGGGPYEIGLYKGWNMVGCPYVSAAPWSSALVDYGGLRLTAQEAVTMGWIGNYIYSYDPVNQRYSTASVSSAVMQPWQSQWVKVKVDAPITARTYNASFQGTFGLTTAPDCTGQVASDWSAFAASGEAHFTVGSVGVTDGVSQKVMPASSAGWFVGGIYQQIAVLPGQRYTFSAWTRRDMNCSGVSGTCRWPFGEGTQVGIDPTGGTDPLASSVVWSSTESLVGDWSQQLAYATAQSSTMTVFVAAFAGAPGTDRSVYIDNAQVSGGHDITLIVNPGYTTDRL